ncbi:MAG: hypothetical protein C0613_01735 [Desulfobulbaceae bacterium]|nr:MAG: hypothetical protein C0613_01735 [Desulfobulbaceae bacterium]
MLALILLGTALGGCGATGNGDRLSAGGMAIERKARHAYEHAVAYMERGHYLLARQHFAEAVALAMSQQLHDDALAGLGRVEKIIAQRR